MEVICKAKFIRIAPRKTRLVASLVRGMSVAKARTQLQFSPKLAAKPILKAINSAAANAAHNHQLDINTLFISRITVDEGPKIKRFTPRAQGRATPIRLRMSHITVAVSPREDVQAAAAPAVKAKKAVAKKPRVTKTKTNETK